jgi:hypothetical protein
MQLQDAAQRFRTGGLVVRTPQPNYLMIATGVTEAGDGIRLFQDACALIGKGDGQYLAVFPSAGHMTVDVPGTLDELVPLVEQVYRHHHGKKEPFYESVREVILKAPDWSRPPLATKT